MPRAILGDTNCPLPSQFSQRLLNTYCPLEPGDREKEKPRFLPQRVHCAEDRRESRPLGQRMICTPGSLKRRNRRHMDRNSRLWGWKLVRSSWAASQEVRRHSLICMGTCISGRRDSRGQGLSMAKQWLCLVQYGWGRGRG